jgi:hypothetical protein
MLAISTEFCDWVQGTRLSVVLQETSWAVPALQTVHILAIASVFVCTVLLSLRILGVSAAEYTLPAVAQRLLPVVWWSVPVLLVTGSLLIVAEPARSLQNWAFQAKMLLLIVVLTSTVVFQRSLPRDATTVRRQRLRAALHGTYALLSLALWLSVIVAGRFIAYIRPS